MTTDKPELDYWRQAFKALNPLAALNTLNQIGSAMDHDESGMMQALRERAAEVGK